MHRDTLTRSWGPLLCPSSAAITSCFSLIMHSPMSQGSVHSSWMLKMSQFFLGLHTHQTPVEHVGCSGSTCTTAFSSSRKYPESSHSHWRGVGQHSNQIKVCHMRQIQQGENAYSTGHNQHTDQLYAKEMCHDAWSKWWSHQILTGFLIQAPTFLLSHLLPTAAYVYSQVMWNP